MKKQQHEPQESSNAYLSASQKQRTSILMTSEQLENSKKHPNALLQELNLASNNDQLLVPSSGKQIQGNLIILDKQITIGGLKATKKQQGFDEKRMSVTDDLDMDLLDKIGIAVACKKGLKSDCPNQDDYFIIVDNKSKLFGVFDGHGPFGHDISDYVHSNLPQIIMANESWETDPCQVLKDSFIKCHNDLISGNNSLERNSDCLISGTTATVAYLLNNILYVSHVGDSRAVIAQKIDNLVTAKNLTTDHRPDLPEEAERIKKCGGEIRKLSEAR